MGSPFPNENHDIVLERGSRRGQVRTVTQHGSLSPLWAGDSAEPVGKPPTSSSSITGPHSFIRGSLRCACRRLGCNVNDRRGALRWQRPAQQGREPGTERQNRVRATTTTR